MSAVEDRLPAVADQADTSTNDAACAEALAALEAELAAQAARSASTDASTESRRSRRERDTVLLLGRTAVRTARACRSNLAQRRTSILHHNTS